MFGLASALALEVAFATPTVRYFSAQPLEPGAGNRAEHPYFLRYSYVVLTLL